MNNKMKKWLENPALFRYGFFILMLLNYFLYFTQFDPEITEVFLSFFKNDKENMAFINHLKTSEEYEIVKDLNIQVS